MAIPSAIAGSEDKPEESRDSKRLVVLTIGKREYAHPLVRKFADSLRAVQTNTSLHSRLRQSKEVTR